LFGAIDTVATWAAAEENWIVIVPDTAVDDFMQLLRELAINLQAFGGCILQINITLVQSNTSS
jgi:hypothetical protein